MKFKQISIFVLLTIIFNIFFSVHVSGGVVPGTIEKGTFTSPTVSLCNISSSNTYNVGFTCNLPETCTPPQTVVNTKCSCVFGLDTVLPGLQNCRANLGEQCVNDGLVEEITCDVGCTLGTDMFQLCTKYAITDFFGNTVIPAQYDKINFGQNCLETLGSGWYNDGVESIDICSGSTDSTPIFTTQTFDNFVNDTYNYDFSEYSTSVAPGYIILSDDNSLDCTVSTNGTSYQLISSGSLSTCGESDDIYFSSGAIQNGSCSPSSISTRITTSVPSQDSNSVYNYNDTNSDSDTCEIEGRVAKIDSGGPNISFNGGTFTADNTKWCNLDRFTNTGAFTDTSYGTSDNPKTEGCDEFNNTGTGDLVTSFSIDIQDESSISSAQIEFGKCLADYQFSTDISEFTDGTGNGVISSFSSTLRISSHSVNSYGGKDVLSLKDAFGVENLHDCLAEGKNYVEVTAYDNARSSDDGFTENFNSSIFSTLDIPESINIDTKGAAFQISSTYNTGTWYNQSLTGSFIVNDTDGSADEVCSEIVEVTDGGTCDFPTGSNWTWLPAFPDGKYSTYTCNGVNLPDIHNCNDSWECDSGYVKNGDACSEYTWSVGDVSTCLGGKMTYTARCVDSLDNTYNISNCGGTGNPPTGYTYESHSTPFSIRVSNGTCGSTCFTLGSSQLGNLSTPLCTN